jgi:PhoPQ-activated pathogenicity-related protein/predicted secreted protein
MVVQSWLNSVRKQLTDLADFRRKRSASQRRNLSRRRRAAIELLEDRALLTASISIDGNFSDWASLPSYTDLAGDPHDTDHKLPTDTPALVNHPDVDLLEYKVTHDSENFYFYFRATGEIGRTASGALGAGRYYVIVTIDVDNDDSTGYLLNEGGYFPTSDGYDMNAEIEFYNGALNTRHYLNHGATNRPELQQAFADQSQGLYDFGVIPPNAEDDDYGPFGAKTQGPFAPGFVEVLPGIYDTYTQWVYKDNDPALSNQDSITFVQDKGPIVLGIGNHASSATGHEMEMVFPFRGFLNDQLGNPIVGLGSTVDISFSLEASGELAPGGKWASDTGEPIVGYHLGDPDVPEVTLTAPTLTLDTTPSVTVTATNSTGLPNGTVVALDVDLNDDGDFGDPGELDYATSSLTSSTSTFDVTPSLVDGTYNLRARVASQLSNEGTSDVVPMLVVDTLATALDSYVAAPNPTFDFLHHSTLNGPGYTAHILNVTSQTWRTPAEVNKTVWQHWVTVIVPDVVTEDQALLNINSGSTNLNSPASVNSTLVNMALTTNSIVIDLPTVPNQALTFTDDASNPRYEDEIIAYTFDKFLNGGDDEWPLLLPMVNSAVRTMDVVQEFIPQITGGTTELNGFVVSGASKRGWTTWLTAAVDPRVTAIAPKVIDVLNIQDQMIHHVGHYRGITERKAGDAAEALRDYIDFGLIDRMISGEADALTQIVDPFSYLNRPGFEMPKYVVNSAGDEFFVPDSAQYYFDQLPGEQNYLRYVPNTGHGLNSNAVTGIANFYNALLDGSPLPQFSWTTENNRQTIRLQTVDAPENVNLWQATNLTNRDFRAPTFGPGYTSSPLSGTGGEFVATITPPASGATAFFIEMIYNVNGTLIPFTTEIAIVSSIDFGDAPDTASGTGPGNYQTLAADAGPAHLIVPTLFMGAAVDPNSDGFGDGVDTSGNASDDDLEGSTPDDEDGLNAPAVDLLLTAGDSPTVDVTVTNTSTDQATLYGWIDYNGDGVFNNETERASVVVPTGTNGATVTLTFPTVPADAVNSTFARFRLSSDPVAADPAGLAFNGEVEDYAVAVQAAPGFTIIETGGGTAVHESAASDTFTVALNSQPATNVVLIVSSGDPGEATVDQNMLTFSPANWSTPQTVTVIGVADLKVDGGQTTTITVSVDDDNSDNTFDQLPNQTVSVTTTDEDIAVVTITAESKHEGTGGTPTTFTFSISLSNPVDAIVSMSASTQDSSATAVNDFTAVSGRLVSFPAGDTTIQTVEVEVNADSESELDEAFDLVMSNLAAGGLNVIFDGGGPTLTSTATILNDDIAPAITRIIDDGDAGLSTVGSWPRVSNKPQVQEGDFLYNGAGTGLDKATWTFDAVTPGQYRVSVSYRSFDNRASNAPFTIHDGAAFLTTVSVNQQQAANSLIDDGIPFRDLGEFNIVSGTLTVELTDAANGIVVADAVRIERLGNVIPGPEIQVSVDGGVLDDDTGIVNFGDVEAGRNVSKVFTVTNLGTTILTLTNPIALPTGFMLSSGFGSTILAPFASTTFEIAVDTAVLGNQSGQASFVNDDVADDENPFNFTVQANVVPATGIQIIDNGDTGYSTAGSWASISGNQKGHQNDFQYANSGTGLNVATWSFDVIPGQYRVAATWKDHTNRSQAAPYTIFNDSAAILTVTADQSIPASGIDDDNSSFKPLGIFNISSTRLVVTLTDNATGLVIADAIRIERVGNIPSGPEIGVIDSGSEIEDNGVIDFGDVEQGQTTIKTLTVFNFGTTDLTLTGPITTSAGFTATNFGSTTLAANESTTFDLEIDTSSLGSLNGTVSFGTNDTDENPFNFVVQANIIPASTIQVIDNSIGVGFSQSGSWTRVDRNGHNNNFDFAIGDSTSTSTSTWTFDVADPGQYRISATWRQHTNRASNARFSLNDSLSSTVFVDQRVKPNISNGISEEGSIFEDLGVFRILGNTLTVTLDNFADGLVIADAIRIERVGD